MVFGSLSIVSSNPIPDPSPSSPFPLGGTHRKAPSSLSFRLRRRRASPTAASASSVTEDDADDVVRFADTGSASDFMRFRSGGAGGGSGAGELQTAVVTYRKKLPLLLLQPSLQVDLVSTIHVADKEYFDTLQNGLQLYDCVLYEMVVSKESLEDRKSSKTKRLKASHSRGFNILEFIQRQMARILALDFQLDCLNYQADNWFHADLDFETFKMLQLEKGENLFTFARDMTIRSTKALVQPASIPNDLGPWRSKLLQMSRVLPMPLVGILIIGGVCSPSEYKAAKNPELEALSSLKIGTALKIFLAKRLTSESTQLNADVEEKIIGERNRVAMEALQRAIDSGHKRIAVLYGGGHMPDLGRRLREEFDMVPSQVEWITAWSIRERAIGSSSLPFLRTLAEISGWPLNRYQTLALLIFSSVLAVDLWFWELFFDSIVDWASWASSENIFTENFRVM
ncbi:uncharacterized protein M6B38_287300 [Iris pallida]|uniref:Thermosome subunit gamma n=1 Tax=Iris pallida TaxID=29817 RepID=A0AAX6HWP8_IRIPA|nr:uncharacterized protein M6B38_287300 [Iris pallida]